MDELSNHLVYSDDGSSFDTTAVPSSSSSASSSSTTYDVSGPRVNLQLIGPHGETHKNTLSNINNINMCGIKHATFDQFLAHVRLTMCSHRDGTGSELASVEHMKPATVKKLAYNWASKDGSLAVFNLDDSKWAETVSTVLVDMLCDQYNKTASIPIDKRTQNESDLVKLLSDDPTSGSVAYMHKISSGSTTSTSFKDGILCCAVPEDYLREDKNAIGEAINMVRKIVSIHHPVNRKGQDTSNDVEMELNLGDEKEDRCITPHRANPLEELDEQMLAQKNEFASRQAPSHSNTFDDNGNTRNIDIVTYTRKRRRSTHVDHVATYSTTPSKSVRLTRFKVYEII